MLQRHCRAILIGWLASASSHAAEAPSWPEASLEIVVNSQDSGHLVVALRETSSSLWLEAGDFHALRLRLPAASPHAYEGRSYYPLSAIPGMTMQLDERQQRVLVHVPAAAFEPSTRLAAHGQLTQPTPASPGVFLNYQLSSQHISDETNQGALAKVGVFGPAGVLTNSIVMRNAGGETQEVRLDSTYALDFPNRLETLTVGDAISNPGSWGNSVRFAGLHFGTNFGIRPDLITTPLLSVGGAAVLPSTIDVLVDNQHISSQPIQPGEFVINNVPPLSGEGQISAVVRDALGRVQLITQTFYSSSSLLASGLSQYSLDLGPIREDYALDSNHYGRMVGAGTYRRGLNDELTLEGHAEFQERDAHAAGLNAAMLTGSFGVLTLTTAAGGAAGSSGWLGGVSFEHHASILTLTASSLMATTGFRQVGDQELVGERFSRQTLLQAGFNLQRAGSLSIAWVQQSFPSQATQTRLGLNHYLSLGAVGTLLLSLSRSGGAEPSTGVFVSFIHPLANGDAVSIGAQGGQGVNASPDQMVASVSHSPPVGPGAGYRLDVSSTGDYDADWREQLRAGEVEFDAARTQGFTNQSVTADGTLTWLGGELYAARTSAQSFAVVKLSGLGNVPVYVDNQFVARTDASGAAFLPNLLPYTANRVSIDPTDLPLDTELKARTIVVAPPFNSGVTVDFPVQRIRAGLFRLVTGDGTAVPAGATVRFNGASFPVALDGVVYVTNFDGGSSGLAQWDTGSCRFRLAPPPRNDPLPDMGTISCHALSTGFAPEAP
jgi:outer membrane usher protein